VHLCSDPMPFGCQMSRVKCRMSPALGRRQYFEQYPANSCNLLRFLSIYALKGPEEIRCADCSWFQFSCCFASRW